LDVQLQVWRKLALRLAKTFSSVRDIKSENSRNYFVADPLPVLCAAAIQNYRQPSGYPAVPFDAAYERDLRNSHLPSQMRACFLLKQPAVALLAINSHCDLSRIGLKAFPGKNATLEQL
jgi:hypothetical protein